MAAQGNIGVVRVLEKLENSIKEGNYYEAHQMYRTLYFRYLKQKKYNDLKIILFQGAIDLLDANQKSSGADIGMLLVDVLHKSEEQDCALWAPKLSTIFGKIGSANSGERDAFLTQAIKWSSQGLNRGDPILHQAIAKIYWDELNYRQARHHYIHSQDGKGLAKLLIEFQMTKGFKNEVDLFIAQAVLQFLCLRNQITASQTFIIYTENHPTIQKAEPPYLLPLLNFIWFLLQAVESRKIQLFAILCEQYEPSIRRDPCYVQYLDKIGQLFFNVKPPKEKRTGGIFGNILENFLGGLEDSDDESQDNKQAASTSRSLIENSEMD